MNKNFWWSFPGGSNGKESTCQCRRPRFDPWVGKILWRRKWLSTPVLLPGKSHGQRSLVGYSPWGRKESDTTEQLHFHLSCSELRGAWWAAIYGVAQSRTRLKWQQQQHTFALLFSPHPPSPPVINATGFKVVGRSLTCLGRKICHSPQSP